MKITIFPIEFYRLEQYINVGLCVVFPFGEDARIGKNSVQTMKFVLKQYDTALLSFDLRSEGLDGFSCTLLGTKDISGFGASLLSPSAGRETERFGI